MLIVVEDRRERRRIEHALRESDRSFRELAYNVPGALFRYVLRPDGTNAVPSMSPRYVEL